MKILACERPVRLGSESSRRRKPTLYKFQTLALLSRFEDAGNMSAQRVPQRFPL